MWQASKLFLDRTTGNDQPLVLPITILNSVFQQKLSHIF
jgi:hypothetical protein